MNEIAITRDRWLNNLVNLMRPEIRRLTSLNVPRFMTVSASRAAMRGQQVQGQCNTDQTGRRLKITILISPDDNDRSNIAATLAHELIHAAAPHAGHDWTFREAAQRLGLKVEGDSGFTRPTAGFHAWAGPLLDQLPAYPGEAEALAADQVRPPRWRSVYISCAIILATVGCFYVTPSSSYALARTHFFGSVLMAMLTPFVLVIPGLIVAVGLTDNLHAKQPDLRQAAQFASVVVPPLIGIAAWLWWNVTPGQAEALKAEIWHELLTEHADFMAANVGYRIWQGEDLTLAASLHAMLTAYLLFSIPVALILWFTRPVSRYYRIGRFIAPTPPFLIHGALHAPGISGFSRSNPDHMGLMLALISQAARIERALLGLRITNDHGEELEPDLLPSSGFVIEKPDQQTVLVAAGLDRPLHSEEIATLKRSNDRFKVNYPGEPKAGNLNLISFLVFGAIGFFVRHNEQPFVAAQLNRADVLLVKDVRESPGNFKGAKPSIHPNKPKHWL